MAGSSAHKFGQIIGNLVESILLPELEAFCRTRNLYLDYQEKDRKARKGRKVTWKDKYGNTHDLDFVVEKDGSDTALGRPIAFIEVAWRRYTKHSRNKVQEIQGAILPLAEKYEKDSPFLGVVLAGEFTKTSITQLSSQGFQVLYLPYEMIMASFKAESVDVRFDEDTLDELFSETCEAIKNLPTYSMNRIKNEMLRLNRASISEFFKALDNRLGRRITRITVIPLYGELCEFPTIKDAIYFLNSRNAKSGSKKFRKFEIQIVFSNGDNACANFESKEKILEFLDFMSKQ